MPRVFLFPVIELVGIVNRVEFWGELTITAHLVMCIGTSRQHLHRLYFHNLHLRLVILLFHIAYLFLVCFAEKSFKLFKSFKSPYIIC